MSQDFAHVDFETFSKVNLVETGVDVYAKDPSTGVWCMAWAINDEDVELWKLGDPFPSRLADHILKGGTLLAHNAPFELALWRYVCEKKYGWPWIPIPQMRCTSVMAYAMGLPGSLEKAAAALGLTHQKDLEGSRVMLKLCAPLPDDPDRFYDPKTSQGLFQKLYEYCKQDVRVEREVHKRAISISNAEQELWVLDQTINNRGVKIDVEAAKLAEKIVELEADRLDAKMRELTSNEVATCKANVQLKDWLIDWGIDADGVAKNHVLEMLGDKDIPPHVKEVLKIRQEAAKSSTAKLKRMTSGVSSDGRARGLFQFHGANTGRWAGRRIQLQNLPRPNLSQSEIDDVFKILKGPNKGLRYIADLVSMNYGSPLSVFSDCLRGFIIPEDGHEFLICDYNAIEARVVAWLAGEENILEIFRTTGKIYEHEAAGIYGVEMSQVTKAQRQIGKVAVLALGYGGGVGAFQQMAKGYGVKVTDAEANVIKTRWRDKNQNIVRYWYAIENAAIDACQNAGRVFVAGPAGRQVKFKKLGSFLWCLLPSNRALCYPYPEIKEVETPWGALKNGLTYMAVNSTTNKWERCKTYGGSLTENVTQAVSRDVLAQGMLRLEASLYPVVMHIHDEIVCEVEKGFGSIEEMESLMCEIPKWAEGLPLKAEGMRADRYQK